MIGNERTPLLHHLFPHHPHVVSTAARRCDLALDHFTELLAFTIRRAHGFQGHALLQPQQPQPLFPAGAAGELERSPMGLLAARGDLTRVDVGEQCLPFAQELLSEPPQPAVGFEVGFDQRCAAEVGFEILDLARLRCMRNCEEDLQRLEYRRFAELVGPGQHIELP